MAKKRKKRSYVLVKPSPQLLLRLEETVLEFLKDHDGREFWTNICSHIDDTFIQPLDPIEKEWIRLTRYGRGKVMSQIMKSLEERSIVTRERNWKPYILTSVLDRLIMEVDKGER